MRIDRLVVEDFEPGAYPAATLLVECGSGTYIRSLAADLGAALGGRAHVHTLRRLRVGSFTLGEARTLDEVGADPDGAVVSLAAAMRDLERVEVGDDEAAAVGHGVAFARDDLRVSGTGPFAIVGAGGELLAVYERRGEAIAPAVVVAVAG